LRQGLDGAVFVAQGQAHDAQVAPYFRILRLGAKPLFDCG